MADDGVKRPSAPKEGAGDDKSPGSPSPAE